MDWDSLKLKSGETIQWPGGLHDWPPLTHRMKRFYDYVDFKTTALLDEYVQHWNSPYYRFMVWLEKRQRA